MSRSASAALSGVFGTILFANGAIAAPLHYQESVSGDLPGSPTITLQFDIGTNTVQGSSSITIGGFDSFQFTIPSGTSL